MADRILHCRRHLPGGRRRLLSAGPWGRAAVERAGHTQGRVLQASARCCDS